MNRHRYSKPSLATADTICQKCLKKGHYSYECTAAQQDRPYVSRPSRTQQFLNPKLAPKITEPLSKALQPSPSEKQGSDVSKRKTTGDDFEASSRKRSRSLSSSSSDSVSSISTNRSRSVSHSPPARRRRTSSDNEHRISRVGNVASDQRTEGGFRKASSRETGNPPRRESSDDSRDHVRRRRSGRSSERSNERHTRSRDRLRTQSRSPAPSRPSGQPRPRSHSPYRRRDSELDRIKNSSDSQRRERSLSPYSKRVALTRASR